MFGMLLSYAWFFGDNFVPATSPFFNFPAENIETAISQKKESGVISVTNQSSGDSVLVDSVTVPPPGVWIAVREVHGNDLGNVLGALRVNGPRSAVVVPLLRMTEPNNSYVVELYRDDADGLFDPAVNSVYIDFDTGVPVVVYFLTTP